MGRERGRDSCWNGELEILICKCRNLDTSSEVKQDRSRPKISYIHMPPGFQEKSQRGQCSMQVCSHLLFLIGTTHWKKPIHFSPARQNRWYPWKRNSLSTTFFFQYQKNCFRSPSINPVTNYVKKEACGVQASFPWEKGKKLEHLQ